MDPRAQRILDEIRRAGFLPPPWLERAVTAAVRLFGQTRPSSLHDAVRGLPFWSPVRAAVEAHAAGGMDCFDVLVDTLLDSRPRGRREKVAAARALPLLRLDGPRRDVAVELLTQVVAGEVAVDAWRIRRRAFWQALRHSIALGAMVTAAMAFLRLVLWTNAADMLQALAATTAVSAGLAAVPIAPMTYFGAMSQARGAAERLRAAAARALGELPAPAAVPCLARVAVSGRQPAREAARSALIPALATLEPSHYGQVPVACVNDLCKLLGRGPEDRDLALLDALRRVGGGSAVVPVELQTRLGKTTAVREMAAAVVPLLRQRREHENRTSMLLRPAHVPAAAAGTLLRPAGYYRDEEDDPDRLLRAANAPEQRVEQPAGPST